MFDDVVQGGGVGHKKSMVQYTTVGAGKTEVAIFGSPECVKMRKSLYRSDGVEGRE